MLFAILERTETCACAQEDRDAAVFVKGQEVFLDFDFIALSSMWISVSSGIV